MNKQPLSFLLLTLILLSPGCGYSLAGKSNLLSGQLKSIAVPQFTNKTNEPGIEQIITQEIKTGFINDGRLKVRKEENADLVLKGEIIRYSLNPVSFDNQSNVLEYWVEIEVAIKLKDRAKKINLFEDEFFTKWDYRAEENLSRSEIFRKKAISLASRDFARSLISIVLEGF